MLCIWKRLRYAAACARMLPYLAERGLARTRARSPHYSFGAQRPGTEFVPPLHGLFIFSRPRSGFLLFAFYRRNSTCLYMLTRMCGRVDRYTHVSVQRNSLSLYLALSLPPSLCLSFNHSFFRGLLRVWFSESERAAALIEWAFSAVRRIDVVCRFVKTEGFNFGTYVHTEKVIGYGQYLILQNICTVQQNSKL